jgi:Ca-activated chloride channel homolog
MKKCYLLFVVFLALGALLAIRAQETVFKIDVRLVRLLVTVKNSEGELVGSLEKSDFKITDNGVPQEIAVLERQTAQPLSVTLLIDSSASTGKDFKYEIASIEKFVRALVEEGNERDAAALYSFNWQVTLLNTFTRRPARVIDRLKLIKPEGGTSLYDAIYLAGGDLRDRDGRHVMVAVTDGDDTTSSKKFRDAVEAAQRADAVVYPVVVVPITNPAGRNTGGEHALETLAAQTGGRTFYPTVGESLDRVFADILRDLRTQYLLGYYPRGVSVGDRAFHSVKVQVPQRTDLRVSSRNGYYGDSAR